MLSIFKKSRENGDGGSLRAWIILIAAVAGIALLLFGGMADKKSDKKEEAAEDASQSSEMILYQTYLESRVKALCESVAGVGEVTAIVTLEGGFEAVYATEMSDGDEVYVVLGSGSGSSALFLTQTAPVISGIGVVCHGGGNERLCHELTELVSAAFHISSNRIYITAAGK